MSVTIILVHGRSQQFANRIELETRFENALLAGLAAARVTQLPSREQMLFPYYGDLFENFSLALDRPVTIQEKKERLEFERDIAQRIKAKMEARRIAPLPPEEGAAVGLFDPLLELLDRIPGFGPGVVRTFTRDVFDYQRNVGGLRDRTMLRVMAPIMDSQGQGNAVIVIAHSMGCIVTYDILNTHPALRADLYITLGCPLAINGAVKSRLLRDPEGGLGVPAGVRTWINVADPDDIVALDETMADEFTRHGAPFVQDVRVENPGSDHHSSDAYLRQRAVSVAVGNVIQSAGLAAAAGMIPGLMPALAGSLPLGPTPELALALGTPAATGLLGVVPEAAMAAAGRARPLAAAAGLGAAPVRPSLQIAEDLQSRGVAPIIVILNDAPVPAAAAGLAAALGPTPGGETSPAERDARAANVKNLATSLLSEGYFISATGPGAALAMPDPEEVVPDTAAGLATRPVRLRTHMDAVVDGVTVPSTPKVYPYLGVMLGAVDANGLARLRLDPRVREVVGAPNISLIRPVGSRVEISGEKITWGLERLGIPQLWAEGLTGIGVLVGHLDTGIDGGHPAFGAINGLPKAIHSFVTVDELGDPPDRGTSHAPVDSGDHGTHTAGTVVGRPVGGTAFGIAPGAQLLSAMVIEAGNRVARILAGMNWAVENGARILSLSLGFRGFREDFLPVMDAVLQRGVLPVIAVGNEGVGTSRSPGNYQRVLSVGASDQNNRVPDFSSSQTLQHPAPNRVAPDLVAPGEDILSANVGGGTRFDSGTSMAAPHVTGLAALLMEACPDATAQQVQTAIFQSCSRPTTMSRSRANRGAPDGLQALAILRSLPGVNAQPAKPVHPALTGFVPTGAAAPTDTPDGGEPERPQRGRAAKQKRVAKADETW